MAVSWRIFASSSSALAASTCRSIRGRPFGENMRALKWIFERCAGDAHARETALGLVPDYADLDWSGLDLTPARFDRLMAVERDEWSRELDAHDALFAKLGDKRPPALMHEREQLRQAISSN